MYLQVGGKMKRSRMVSLICVTCNQLGLGQTVLGGLTDDHYDTTLEEADKILQVIEKLGMLPPDNGKEAYDILDYRSKCLRWEAEDE